MNTKVLHTIVASLLLAASTSFAAPSANEALNNLAEGNARFVAGKPKHPNQDATRRTAVATGQNPFATVLSCSDSRVPVEVLFDQGIGDTFVVRVAGNVSDVDEIGSIEYGVGHLNTPLLVIMGHTSCGAVKAVTEGAQVHGSIPKLVDNIGPAVAKARQSGLTGPALVAEGVKWNVWTSIDDVFKNSSEVRQLVSSGKLTVVGAVYELDSGKVNWLGAHPEQARLLAYTSEGGGHGAATGHDDHAAAGGHDDAAGSDGGHAAPAAAAGHTTTAATSHATKVEPTNQVPWIIGGLVLVALLGFGIHSFAQNGMKQWTVGRRLATGFGLLLGILTLVGVIAYQGFHSAYEGFVEYRTDARHSVLAGRLQANFLEMRIAAKDFALTKKAHDVAHYNQRKAKVLEFIEEAKKEIHQPERLQVLKSIESELAEHYNSFAEIVTLAGKPGSAQRASQLTKTMSRVGETIDHQVEDLKMEFIGDQNHAGPVIQNQIKNAQALGLWLSIGALLLGILSAFSITRSITGPLQEMAGQIGLGANQVTDASAELASTSQTLAEGASEQAASLEETSASLEEISAMTKRNSDNAENGKALGTQARQTAADGITNLGDLTRTLDSIKSAIAEMQAAVAESQSSSQEISKIIKTIDEIAFQTNLLALNAAVEAARAGEAGMGFAVVADEVRALAQRSAQAARDTSNKIEAAVKRSELGGAASGKVVKSLSEVEATAQSIQQVFTNIASQIKSLDEVIAEIASACKEQSQGVGEVNMAVSQMDKVTQSNAASAEENAASSEEMSAQAATLQDIVGQLQKIVSDQQPSAASRPAGQPARRPAAAAFTAPVIKKSTKATKAAPVPAEAHEDFGASLQASPKRSSAPSTSSFQDF